MKKLRVLFDEIANNKLVLPDFQRDFEWKIEGQRKLLASFFTMLPIGSLLLLNGSDKDFATKKMCFPTGTVNPKEECSYLLDGQQRISSLKSIFFDFFNDPEDWLETWTNIYKDLRNRWFVRIQPQVDEDDIFGWGNLDFKGLKEYEPGQIFDFFEVRPIFKTKINDWYNPGFCPKDEKGEPLTENKLKARIAKHAAEESLVPLYTVYGSIDSQVKPLHTYVLEEIASLRIKELKAEVADGNRDIVETLEVVEPNILDLVQNKDEESITLAWIRLSARWSEKVNKFINELMDSEISIIELPSNEISRAIAIFESINRGGTPLDTFDLVVARAARDKELGSLSLRILMSLKEPLYLTRPLCHDLKAPKPSEFNMEVYGAVEDNKLTKIIKYQFLNLLSLFSYCEYGDVENLKLDLIKRNKILELNHIQININTELTINSLSRACAFLHYRCGIVNIKDLSYELMILPIAYILRQDEVWHDYSKLAKIEYWYWSSIFGGAYRQGQNDRCIRDIRELHTWVNGGENPFKARFESIFKDQGYSDENLLLLKDTEHSIPGAIHRGILQFMLSKQPKDFLPSESIYLNTWDVAQKKELKFNEAIYPLIIEDHHICPLAGATKIGESSKEIRNEKHILNSPLNRTYISSLANNLISSKSAGDYLNYISESSQWKHCIPTPVNEVYRKQEEESDEEYYERVLKRRFQEIYKEVKTELEHLEQS